MELTKKTSDGHIITIQHYLGKGTFSERYKVLSGLDNEVAQLYFMKKFSPPDSGAGRSSQVSRDIIKNEIAVGEFIREHKVKSLYEHHTNIDDVLCLLFRFIEQSMGRNGGEPSLKQLIGEKLEDKQIIEIVDANQRVENSLLYKQNTIATSYSILSLENAVNIARQVAEEMDKFHHHGEPGIIHFDICPANILYVKSGNSYTAQLTDFAIARKNGQKVNTLLNGVQPDYGEDLDDNAPVTRHGSYYIGGNEPPYNFTYSPLNLFLITQEEKTHKIPKIAEPSIDTYALTNTLCLMLTGRLSEYWLQEAEKSKTDLVSLLTEEISSRKRDQKTPYEDKVYEHLAKTIVKGTNPLNAEERYTTAQDLLADLNLFKLYEAPQESIWFPKELLSLPDEIRTYRISDSPLSEFYKEKRIGLEKVLETPTDYIKHSSGLPNMFKGIDERIILEKQKHQGFLNFINRNNTPRTRKIAKAIVITTLVVAAGTGAVIWGNKLYTHYNKEPA